MFKILKNLKKTWVSVVIIVILLCIQAWTDLTLPDYTSKIVNDGIQPIVEGTEGQSNYILIAGIKMIGIALLSMSCAVAIMFLSSRVAANLGRTLREKVFKKVLQFTRKEFMEFSTASLITRTTNDVQQIQMLITMLFRTVVYAPIMGIGAFIRVLTNSNNSMAWVIGLAILCIIGIVLVLFIIAMPKFKKLQDLVDRLNLVSREILTGLPVIRAFNTEKKEEKRFDDANTNLMKTNIFVNRTMSIMMPALMFVMNSVMLLIVWVGAGKVDEGIMQVGDIMAFIQYTMHIVISFLVISMISIMLPRAQVSARRINEVLETEPSIKDKEEVKEFIEEKKGYVEFKNVSFRYPDADTEILEDITFTAKPGETTALIGSTGSGKSTVVNLIPRFYDVTGGELLIDGVNIKDVPQKELRSRIGFVPQRGVLFSGTIESNIKYGNNTMSDEQMKKAAEIAMGNALRERHQMVPYLYTMNYRAHKDAAPIVMPMYYDYPEEQAAYQMKNQFMFGTELMAAPITSKRINGLNVAEVKVWLPEGLWYDIYTGTMYDGDRILNMYRDLDSIPVLAKAGAILPLTDEISAVQVSQNPTSLRVKVYAGADGSFELYEDDNETCAYEAEDCVKTMFTYTEGEKAEFVINPAKGNLSLIPKERSYTVELTGYQKVSAEQLTVLVENQAVTAEVTYDAKKQAVIVQIPSTSVQKEIRIIIDKALRQTNNRVEEQCFDFLNQAEIEFALKEQIFATIQKEQNKIIRDSRFKNMLIQGVAGSGKTSIALHRAAYLLYSMREKLNAENILVVSISDLFSKCT